MTLRLLMIILAAALVALPGVARATTGHAASNSQTFPDSIGEDPNGPDITSIVVANDDAGNITFKVNISNRPTLTQDMLILLFLNTDENTNTGDPRTFGSDYVIQLVSGDVALFQWNGSSYAPAPAQTSLTYAYDATGATIHINASELSKTTGFDFLTVAFSGITTDAQGNPDFTNAHSDTAPDPGHGTYTYPVITKLTLTPTAFTTVPSPARAGRRFTASLGVTESDTGGPIQNATITCVGVIHGKRLPAKHTLANGIATCYWNLPKTAKGTTLYGAITVTIKGTKLVKSFHRKLE